MNVPVVGRHAPPCFFQAYGFILYRHKIQQDAPMSELSVPGIRDRGYVMLDGVSVTLLEKSDGCNGPLDYMHLILWEGYNMYEYGLKIV